ncbi:response regulator, partial [bacterium]|nr:response regulator [bacterium]
RVEVNGEYQVKLTVADSGMGISDQHIHQVFDRFYRVDKNISGSGIGLALTKVLVELHNGTIEVESTEGKGSVFYVTLPYKQKDISINEQYPVLDSKTAISEEIRMLETDESDDEPEQTKINSEKPLVLIVDDNADVRQYVKTLLHNDFEILEAANGQAGLLKAMRNVPELIISDVMMDVMDGFELCKQLKENITTSHIPVMLLTACAQDEQRAQGFESGADAYIPKPFNEDLLKIRVRKIVENREKVKAFFQKNLTFGERKESVAEIDKTFINKFRKVIEKNLIDSDLNVDEIGKNLGLSRVQLYRKIKSLTNYAPNELVRIIRLKAA